MFLCNRTWLSLQVKPGFPCHVSTCTCRCLTWSWARSSTSLRTRRRVDKSPRSCPTSSSTARLWNSLVENILVSLWHTFLSLSFSFSHTSFPPPVLRGFLSWPKENHSSSKPPPMPVTVSLSPFFPVFHSHVKFRRSNLSPCFLNFFLIARHLISQYVTLHSSPTQDTH